MRISFSGKSRQPRGRDGLAQDVSGVARAALAGAAGVALPAEQLSEEVLAELIHACHALDLEPFVEVKRRPAPASFRQQKAGGNGKLP